MLLRQYKKIFFRVVGFFLLLNFSLVFTISASELTKTDITADELKVATKIYKRYCAKCHGKQGKGDGRMNKLYLKLRINAPSNFTIGYFEDRPVDYLKRIISEGGETNDRSKYMPPFVNELSEDKIDLLVKLIKVTGEMRKMP